VGQATATSGEGGAGGASTAELVRGSAVVMAGFVLSRLLGLAREIIIGAQYGTSGAYDAYVAAFRLPDTLFLLIMSGAFGSAFLPVFVGLWTRGDPARAWRLANAVITLAVTGFLALAAVCFALAPWLVATVIAPGMAGAQLDLAVGLTRLLLLSPLLLGLGAAAMGILNARRQFAWPAFAPVAYNLGIIAGALLLSDRLGIYGLALGVLIGAAGHCLLQAPGLWRAGLRYRPVLSLRVDGLAEMARLLGPRVLGQAAFQVNFIILTNLASRLAEGRLAALNYAYLLAMLPHGIFAMSLATVVFPTLAEQFGREQYGALRATVQTALRLLLFLTVPAAAGLIVLRVPLVQVLLQWRAFTAESTALVSEALGWFALGLVGVAVVEALTRAFYAMHDTATPVLASLASIVLNVLASLVLIGPLGHGGLALALSLAGLAEMTVLLIVLRRRLGPLLRGLAGSLGRTALATAVMVGLLLPVGEALAVVTSPARGRGLGEALWLLSALAVGLAGYLTAAVLAGSPEAATLWRVVAGRLPGPAARRTAAKPGAPARRRRA
jgi:putative peptidoglycan lipid II flippase